MHNKPLNIETIRQNLAAMVHAHNVYHGVNPRVVVTGVEWEDGEWLPTAVWKAAPVMPEGFKDHRHE